MHSDEYKNPSRARAASGSAAGQGFTLIELIVVVAVVAILAAIAIPGYEYAMVKARRGAAKGCLTEQAQRMERHYTVNMTYANAPAPSCGADAAPYYQIAFSGVPDASGYVLEITPQGRQATGDTMCGTMTMDQTGKKTGLTSDCWN
jgi:type IV pilus assembly protein PilE